MRWDGLFADLEAQAEALEQAECAAEVETRTRGEVGRLALADRLRGALGSQLRLRVAGGLLVTGALTRVGPDWVLLTEAADREVVLVLAHVLGVRGLGRLSAAPGSAGVVESRLGLRHALRGIVRDRSAVRVHLTDARPTEFGTIDGTLDRVGADFVEVATHPTGEARRRADVLEVELVPLAAIAAVRRAV